jgi:cell shape-determining protein MreC
MRNRAAAWGWGVLIVLILILAIFASDTVVLFFSKLRGSSAEINSITKISDLQVEKKFDRYIGISAGVYSQYPFNDRNFIFLNRGLEDGVVLNSPVFGSEGELVGGVSNVDRTRSQVETFWSSTWKTAVYVGEKKSKAVLKGGESPILEFLPKNSGVKVGDVVYNASPEFPLYAPIGKVFKILNDDQNPWFGAEVEPLTDLSSLREVWVFKNFP